MRRRRRTWLRRISKAIVTVAIGGMLGFLVPTVAAEYSPKAADVQTPIPEAPIAHRFIEAFVADDQAVLTDMGMSADVKLRASRFRAEYTKVDPPIHLGSFVGGGYSVHAYGIKVVRKDGTEALISWRVFSAGGQVGLISPPNPIEAE